MNRCASNFALHIVAVCLSTICLLTMCLATTAISASLVVAQAESQVVPANPSAAPASSGNAPASKASTTSSGAPTAQEIAAAKASGKVWVNTETGVYHKGGRWYGKTKKGKFMTEAEAKAAGYKGAKRD